MYVKLFLVLIFVTACFAQDDTQEIARKRYKHKFGLHHHGIYYYLAFLAVKVKIVFLIGSLISFWMFAGKLFAILKYGFANFKSAEPEKIFVQPTHPTFYGTTGSSYFDHDASGDRGDYKYGRNIDEGAVNEAMAMFRSVMQKFDLNEYAFESMDLKTEECRKRFVCEVDYKARKNPLLMLGMQMINDNSLDKYKTMSTIEDIDECSKLYPGCEINSADT